PVGRELGELSELAWSGGRKGRETIDRFLSEVKGWLKPGGRVLMVQSSLSGVRETIRRLKGEGFRVRIAGRRRLFFEELFCLEAWLPEG
ncbi:MAG: protoporphyrinogen oxidase, partial [Candidatus Hecatellales archaeon]